MKNIFLLLLLCQVVFIYSVSTVKELKCKEKDYNAIPGFVLCHREDNITFVERKQYTKNLTIFHQEIDLVVPEIFNKFSPEAVTFRTGDKKSQYFRKVKYSNETKKFVSHISCDNTPWSSWADINDFRPEIIIDLDGIGTIMTGSLLIKFSLTKSDWLNGICKTLPPIKTTFISDFNSTEVDNLPLNLFNSSHHLETLILSCPKITSLPKTFFNNSKSLESLDIRMRLTKLELGIFDGLFSLKSLNLSGNLLESLPENIFKDLHSLEDLDLGYNLLTSIKADTLRHLTSLRALTLNDNKISSIEDDSLPTESITNIILRNNQLSSDSIELFNKMEKLQILDLNANNISRILNNAFDRLKNLLILDLGNNNVTEFESNALAGISLIKLTLPDGYNINDGKITTIDTTTMGEEQQTTFATNL